MPTFPEAPAPPTAPSGGSGIPTISEIIESVPPAGSPNNPAETKKAAAEITSRGPSTGVDFLDKIKWG